MISIERISEIVETIYASILQPDLLPGTYDGVAEVLGGIGAVVIPVTPSADFPPYVSGNLRDAIAEYQRDWWYRDPGVEAARRLDQPLGVYAAEDILDAEVLRTHPMYAEFAQRHGFRHFLSMTLAPLPGVYLIFSVQRRIGAGPVTDDERRLASLLRTHLMRATRLRHQLEYLNRTTQLVMDRLEESEDGMAVLSPAGDVLFSNTAMETLKESGLRIEHGRLKAPGKSDQAKLDEIIAGCVNDSAPSNRRVATISTAGLPFIIRASRLSAHPYQETLFRDFRDFILLSIVDPNMSSLRQPLEELRALGLSLQEARLAGLVGSGFRLKDAALEMNLSISTSRTYLKSIFEKLSVSSQSQLTALVARLK